MSLTRRAFLGGVAVVGASAAGAGYILSKQPITGESTLATIPKAAAKQQGYKFLGWTPDEIHEEREIAGVSMKVKVTGKLSAYERSVTVGPIGPIPASRLFLYTTPKLDIMGKTVDPTERLPDTRVIGIVNNQYDTLDVGRVEEEISTTVLDKATTVKKYRASTQMEGVPIPLYLLYMDIEHGDEHLISLAGYPRGLPDERERVLRLLKNVKHNPKTQ